MGCVVKNTLQDSGLPKAAQKPAMKNVSGVKGIAGKTGGSLGAGEAAKRLSIKGFGKA